MLKKSLHYLIRCSFLLAIICCIVAFNSCKKPDEDYFSFLKNNDGYQFSIYLSDEPVFAGTLLFSSESNEKAAEMTPTYPTSLCQSNVRIKFEGDKIEYTYNGTILTEYPVPELWVKAYRLFLPCENVISVKNDGGRVEIEANNKDNTLIFYVLNSEGILKEIRTEDLKIIVDKIFDGGETQ